MSSVDRPVRFVVVSGGMSEESATTRLAERLERATLHSLPEEERARVEIVRVPLRPLARAVGLAQVSTAVDPALRTALDTVEGADALIVAAPTYKAQTAGIVKAFWDLVEDGSLAGVPVLLAATGGTARHSLMIDMSLRPLFAYLKATTLPTAVFAATDDWGRAEPGDAAGRSEAAPDGAGTPDRLTARVSAAGADLAAAIAGPRVRAGTRTSAAGQEAGQARNRRAGDAGTIGDQHPTDRDDPVQTPTPEHGPSRPAPLEVIDFDRLLHRSD